MKQFGQHKSWETISHLRVEPQANRVTSAWISLVSVSLEAKRTELQKIARRTRGIIEAIKDGPYQPSMKAEMERLEGRKAYLENTLAEA